jgi:hypothetical protein
MNIIEMLHVTVHVITISRYEYEIHATTPPREKMGYYPYLSDWYVNDALGKHLCHIQDPNNYDIRFELDHVSDNYKLAITAWLSTADIDKIETAFFIKLHRVSQRKKFNFEQ